MKKNSKYLVFLLVFTMLLSLAPMSKAESNSILSLDYEKQGNFVDVIISANAKGIVYDGKITLDYDKNLLSYKNTRAENAFKDLPEFSVNSNEAGKIILAFASSEAADAGKIFKLTFEVLNKGKAKVAIDSRNSYVSDADNFTVESSIEFDVERKSVTPSEPSEPEKPAEPDKPHGPRPRPGKGDSTPKPEPRPDAGIDDNGVFDLLDILNNNNAKRFADVRDFDYFKEAVDFVYVNGYMNGISDTMFGPNLATNRAMIVSILWRMEGKPLATSTHNFVDVKPNDYFAQAVQWAYENNITKGISDTKFGPNLTLTREQLVTLIYRYAQYKGYNTQSSVDLSTYKDYNSISKYAVEAMSWAVQNGIVNGTTPSTISPKSSANRAQLATIIMRFAKLYNK